VIFHDSDRWVIKVTSESGGLDISQLTVAQITLGQFVDVSARALRQKVGKEALRTMVKGKR
jgi:hypothetical protein